MAPKVLLVEDEALMRMLLCIELSERGIEVVEVATADEALSRLEADRGISAVVTDIRVPGRIDGVQLVRWMQTERPGLPVVVTSGYMGAPGVELPRHVHLFTKPYKPEEVVASIEKLIR
jgi:DNA-binding NtrC family response regulator